MLLSWWGMERSEKKGDFHSKDQKEKKVALPGKYSFYSGNNLFFTWT